ncbi:ARM repeat-containing protein [Fistulina hepatica ATCC 64428]|uniref:ARM repeat-containing protein n=1 Tax=Fistulina hepatica ATCC 64428 TaxID=1128425 RepID=A0A0D7AMV5_9AGAR|nr:ARM repeat-containing protein [Fistulina hepatica ATCC 64428]
MDYLRTLGSAAVSTIVQKTGLNLPFSLGARVHNEPFFSMYDATKRDDGSLVTVFEYNIGSNATSGSDELAKNLLKRLRTTRHPDIVKFMDAAETDSTIYIMTERVCRLDGSVLLSKWANRHDQAKDEWVLWGLHRVAVALAFLNDSELSHCCLGVPSIYVSPSGEWRLGGFELMSNTRDETSVIYGRLDEADRHSQSVKSPEVRKNGFSVLKDYDSGTADGYALGLLINSFFNDTTISEEDKRPPPRGCIPNSVYPAFQRLLLPDPRLRMKPKGFLEVGMNDGSFFSGNRLVQVCSSLDNFALAREDEKTSLLRVFKDSSSFPSEFLTQRVLPSLLKALDFGGTSAAAIIPLVIQFGKDVSSENYPDMVIAPIVKLFGSPDRSTRMALLDNLPDYAEHLDKKTVDSKIFPHLKTGFEDTVAIIREATVKSILMLGPKLSDRTLNNELLRYLAKMQTDPESSIRTNTCILIGRLAPTLKHTTKRKVLVPAFSRALKDSFEHCRVAALMAIIATIDCFDVEELATKVIPNMSFALLDKEKIVRDQAFQAMGVLMKRIEEHAARMVNYAVFLIPICLHICLSSHSRKQR